MRRLWDAFVGWLVTGIGDAWMSDRLAPQDFRPVEPKPDLPESDGDRWWEQ